MYNEQILDQILEGTLQNNQNHLCGTYKGFHVTINKYAYMLRVRISAIHSDHHEINQLEKFLTEQIRTQKHLISASLEKHNISLNIKSPIMKKAVPEHLNSNILPIISYLDQHGFVSGCMDCGKDTSKLTCEEIYFEFFYLCETCKNK